MPITRRTRKKADNGDDENDKENIHNNERNVRASKVEALRKIEENPDDSCSFIRAYKKTPDNFDLLFSSPMKQEVNFKPLSFWSRKVKDLESKANIKKKKCELYELSETDDSNSSQGSNWGKRPKKNGRMKKKSENKKNVKKFAYDFNVKHLEKKPVVKSRNENKEGSIIRERIMLRRLNNKFRDVEDKFSLTKVTALGLTSTPGKSERLNVVGGSTFDFLSPIPIPESISINKDKIDSDTEGKASDKKVNVSDTVENATPKKKLKKTRNTKKVLTEDLKRVSESEHPTGDYYLEDSFTELSSFTEKHYSGNFINNDICIFENCGSKIESSHLWSDSSFFEFDSFGESENEMNKSFLIVKEDESNEDIRDESKSNGIVEAEYTEHNFYLNPDMHEQESQTDRLLKNLLICPENATEVGDISCGDSISQFDLPFRGASLQEREMIELGSSKNMEIEEYTENESTGSMCSNSFIPNMTIVRRNSSANVTVRRYRCFFLNFRRSAEEVSFELPHDVNNKNQECLGDSSHADLINKTLYTSEAISEEYYDKSDMYYLDFCHTKVGNSTLVGPLSMTQIRNRDQQTHGKQVIEDVIRKMGSNQYRSNDTSVIQIGERMQLYSDSGNDSSVFISSPDTTNAVESILCVACKPAAGRECEEESDGAIAVIEPGLESIHEEHPVSDVTSLLMRRSETEDTADCKWDEESETRGGSPVCSCSSVKPAFVEHSISDITLNDEFDFPPPIFESTTCATPVRERCNAKTNTIQGKMGMEKMGQKPSAVHKDFEDQDMSAVTFCRLKPGKKWARSAMILKKSLNGTLLLDQTTTTKKRGKMYESFIEEVLSMQNGSHNQSLISTSDPMSPSSVTMITSKMSHLSVMMRRTIGNRTVKVLEEVSGDETMENSFRCIFRNSNYQNSNLTVVDGIANRDSRELTARVKLSVSARSLVLMRCNQEAPLPFEEHFNEKTLKNCRKIGEGTFGEVFKCNSNRVIKIMPIEGLDEVNGEPQKKFDEILSEIIIAMELSNLRVTDKYRTNGFCELKRCWCVQGKYPSYLIDLWNDFDCIGPGSENDSPVMFKSDQLFIILEFGNGGKDLEAFVFTSGEQALSILFQVAYTLAVAENVLEFEHRDMHWGNILIAPTREKYFKVTINDEVFKIPTKGVKVTIIDFTLSRIKYDGCCIYNDLAVDPTLFTSEGDYQFEIYRMMKREVMNDWSLFRPKTNIFWLHYVADKMVKMVRYKKTDTKIHKVSLAKLEEIKSKILNFSDSKKFALNCDFS